PHRRQPRWRSIRYGRTHRAGRRRGQGVHHTAYKALLTRYTGFEVTMYADAAVGPTGHVLATDIDVSWLTAGDGYEVRRHDVAADPPPQPGTFDLVHARLVLVHVPDRARALATMAAALRPGGWLLVEDADTALQPLAC